MDKEDPSKLEKKLKKRIKNRLETADNLYKHYTSTIRGIYIQNETIITQNRLTHLYQKKIVEQQEKILDYLKKQK